MLWCSARKSREAAVVCWREELGLLPDVGDSLSNWGDLRDPTPLTEVALRLVARSENGELDPAGTAVMFGDMIALTAKHTIED